MTGPARAAMPATRASLAATRPKVSGVRLVVSAPATRDVAQAPSLARVPDEAAQAGAMKTIREVFKDDLEARTTPERRRVARMLFEQGRDTKDDLAARFVLLRQACEMAVIAGDAATVAQSVDVLAGTFAVDASETKAQALGAVAPYCVTPEDAGRLADACSAAIDQAVAADRYEEAVKIQGTFEAAARQSKRVDLYRAAQERKPQLLAMRQQADDARGALATLKATPDDADASLRAGSFLCLVKNDWETGLPLLARCSDPALKAAAEAELADPDEPELRAKVADRWWDLSQHQTGIPRANLQNRAAAMYRTLMPGLRGKGLTETIAKTRLTEFDQARFAAMRLSAGLNCALFEGKEFQKMRVTRVDPQVNFEWGPAAPAEGMPKDTFSIKWTGQVRVTTPGVYEIAVIANEGARLFIDDQKVIDNPNLSRKRNGEKVNRKLAEGMHAIRLEFWDGTGDAKCKLMWTPPGAVSEAPIPAEALYHAADER